MYGSIKHVYTGWKPTMQRVQLLTSKDGGVSDIDISVNFCSLLFGEHWNIFIISVFSIFNFLSVVISDGRLAQWRCGFFRVVKYIEGISCPTVWLTESD